MTLVIEGWNGRRMYGNLDGGTGRSVNQGWACDTIDSNPFKACSWFAGKATYITQACYNSLSDRDKATTRAVYDGIVGSGYFVIKKWLGADGRYWDRKYFVPAAITECFKDRCVTLRPDLKLDPCDGVVCNPECAGIDLYETVCEDGKCVRGALKEANNIVTCGYVKPVCDEGDKRPGEICRGGDWVEHTPEEPVPGEGRLYVKFAIPLLDRLPWLPYEPWMWIPPGFEIVEVP